MTYQGEGRLTVTRPLDNGTGMVEVWELDNCWWGEGNLATAESGIPLKCSVVEDANMALCRSLPKKKRVDGSCNWVDAPEDVRQEFKAQISRLVGLKSRLNQAEQEADE